MSFQPKRPSPSPATMAILCCLWLAAAASAQDEVGDPLAQARALAITGRHAEAVPIYERLVAEVEQREGREAWALVLLTYELAAQHHRLGAVADAESLYRRSLAIAEAHRGARDPELVPSLRGLATLAANGGRLEAAEALYRRALEIQAADAGSQTGTARTLAELGLLCQLQERPEDAESYYRRALATGEANDLEETEIAVIASNLGALYDRQERYAEAEPRFRRALAIRERLLGPDHPDLARLHERLGRLLYRRGRFAEAALSYERSLRIREHAGQDSLAVAEVLGHLAASYRQTGRSVAAEAHFGMAKAILDAQCGGRERIGPCRDAIDSHRDLSDERFAPPAEPATGTVASSTPPPAPPAAAPSSPPPAAPPSEPAPRPDPETTASPPKAREAVRPREPVEAPAPSAPPPAASVARGSGGDRVHRAQMGAREDPREAAEILTQLRDSYPQLLGNLAARVARADLGERGVWHRVQIGEFRRLGEAKALCAEIVKRGHEGCWVVTTED